MTYDQETWFVAAVVLVFGLAAVGILLHKAETLRCVEPQAEAIPNDT